MTDQNSNDLSVAGLDVRYTVADDASYMVNWLNDPKILRGFPLKTEEEIHDAVRFWVSFYRYKSSLTALYKGEVAGVATLVLSPYAKVAHHALVSIIVGEPYRGKGVGTVLLNNLCYLAKNTFNLEVLYLEVYEENRAISLYRRFGFKEIGRQNRFYKDEIGYLAKIIMEKDL